MNIEGNREMWTKCPWKNHGEEWSQAWGCTANLWQVTIMPRIDPLCMLTVVGTWLEIGCGHGRMTDRLLDLAAVKAYGCNRFVGVDLIQGCVDHCRDIFSDEPFAWFEQTDGESLPRVKDGTVAFAFSWDSLVHCDRATVGSYLRELDRAILNGGYAFLHVSNLGACPQEVRNRTPHLRDLDMSAKWLEDYTWKHTNLEPLLIELVNWGMAPVKSELIDAFVVLQKNTKRGMDRCVWYENVAFMEEATVAREIMKTEKRYINVVGPVEE